MPDFPPIVGLVNFPNQQVFDGTSPLVWTDLNLSSYVGAKKTLVLLKVWVENNLSVAFRENGDTHDYSAGTAENLPMLADSGAYVLLLTDGGGVIEWWSDFGVHTVITLKAYT